MSTERGKLVDELLAEVGPPTSWHSRASEHPCEGTKFHSPTPMTTAQFDDPACRAWLCPTCTSKLEIFLHIHEQDPELLTWDVMREFGNQIRIMGQRIVASKRESADG
jgi:hypothetical protein